MKNLIILLVMLSTCVFAQQKTKKKSHPPIPYKTAIEKGGLLNNKIKQTKWYFDTEAIYEDKLVLTNNTKKPDMINFIDANKFVVTLQDHTTISGTYIIYDLQDMGFHDVPAGYKTFKVNKSADPKYLAKKLTAYLEQYLNVHYDLEEQTMEFEKNEIGPVVPVTPN